MGTETSKHSGAKLSGIAFAIFCVVVVAFQIAIGATQIRAEEWQVDNGSQGKAE